MANTKESYNWHPDLPDHRDHLLTERLVAPKVMPPTVDLRKLCSPVFNQGKIGSCTGNALAGAFEFLERKELAAKEKNIAEEFDSTFENASRLFIYFNERKLEGRADQDSGGRLRDGVKAMQKLGVCPESLWPYEETKVLAQPVREAYAVAEGHRISEYIRLTNLREVKQALSLGYPVAFGFTVFSSFEGPDVARSGVMPLPTATDYVLGGHAVLAVGYDDDRSMLIIRNSWGAQWGDDGYFYMPYDYILKLKLAQDFWLIRK